MGIGARPVRAPRGTELSCRGWQQELALRMLMNDLDPEVAERPDDLAVYGGTGRAARSWEAFDFRGFVPSFIRPLVREGNGPFRWAALRGDPADIEATDRAILDLFPGDEALARAIEVARGRGVSIPMLPEP